MTEKNLLKKCKKTLERVSISPALSCVEYYFIPWAEEKISLQSLYAKTLVCYAQAEKIILESSYEYAADIPRLQNLAEEMGLVSHEKIVFSGACPNPGELLLVKVSADFFRGKLKAWRDDHYVWVLGKKGEKVYIVNEYPMETLCLPADGDWNSGEALVFRFDKERNREETSPVPPLCCPLPDKTPTLIQLRDALLIYRVVLRRAACVFGAQCIKELLDFSDQIFFQASILARRGMDGREFTEQQRTRLTFLEKSIFAKITEVKENEHQTSD